MKFTFYHAADTTKQVTIESTRVDRARAQAAIYLHAKKQYLMTKDEIRKALGNKSWEPAIPCPGSF